MTSNLRPPRAWPLILASAGIAVAVLCVAPLIGSATVDFRRAFAGESPYKEILFDTRLPRVILGVIAGGTLAVAGVLFQALLRDALATPYTLGVSSGASLGAVLAISLGWRHVGYLPAVWLAAFAGAGLVLFLVMGLASEGRRFSSFTLLLAGVSINTICLAMILFLQYTAQFAQTFAIVRWLMGGLETTGYAVLAWLAVATVPALVYAFLHARDWNVMAVGEDWAAARGVSVRRLMLGGYIAGSLLAGSVAAITGPIGFVGLIVPHALRLKCGADHRVLIPCSFFIGAAFLVVCDTIARTLLAPTEIPVGVVTALLGGPFFIWLLRTKRGSLWL